jgi:hypothetical protein
MVRPWPAYGGGAAWQPERESEAAGQYGAPVEERGEVATNLSSGWLGWFDLHPTIDGKAMHLVVGSYTLAFQAWDLTLAAPSGDEVATRALMEELLNSVRIADPEQGRWAGELEAGDCFDPFSNFLTPAAGGFWADGDSPVLVYPCTEPHWFEVVGTVFAPTQPNPCGEVFEAYVGIPVEQSALRVGLIGSRHTPREGVSHICAASSAETALSSSVRGTRR